MPALYDYSPRAIVVMDEKRLRSGKGFPFVLATARNKGRHRGWLLKATGFCWTDPRARDTSKNPFAASYPDYMLVPTKREALRILRSLV